MELDEKMIKDLHRPAGYLNMSSGYRITLKGKIVDAPGLPKDALLLYCATYLPSTVRSSMRLNMFTR